jgi:hypothetical protein
VKSIAPEHIEELERKAAAIQAMAATLKHLVKHCQGDDRPDCPIIDEFANPGDEGAAARDQCPLRSQRAEDGVRWALAAWIQTFASQRPGRPC